MVRIPEQSISLPIPEGINIALDGKKVSVEGPRGKLFKDFSHSPVQITEKNNELVFAVFEARKKEKSMLKTIQAHVNNMCLGVTQGFRYSLKIVYAHFPIQTEIKNSTIIIKNFGGEKASRIAKYFGDVEARAEGDDIIIEGNNIESVAQTAANVQRVCKIKGKDPRVFQDGIYVYKKGLIENA